MAEHGLILVTGAAGQVGAVGRTVTGLLLARGLPVRAMVRREDDRAAALRAAGAEVVVGDLLEPADVARVVRGCRRVYFGLSVSAGYLEATVTMGTVARDVGVDALVNMSQLTVSQMSIQHTTPSPQQRQHWLSEQALAWSGLPVVTIRPTVFLDGSSLPSSVQPSATAAASNCRSGGASPHRWPRRMSPGWSRPSSPTRGRTWARSTNSPGRGRRTWMGSPRSMRRRCTGRSRTRISLPKHGNRGCTRRGCQSTCSITW